MFYLISNIFPSSSKVAPFHIKNFQFKVFIRSSVQNKPSSWPMISTSTVSRVIYQLEDIFRMHHPKRNNYSILHNEKCEKPRTEIFRRSYNVFPSPILKSLIWTTAPVCRPLQFTQISLKKKFLLILYLMLQNLLQKDWESRSL